MNLSILFSSSKTDAFSSTKGQQQKLFQLLRHCLLWIIMSKENVSSNKGKDVGLFKISDCSVMSNYNSL